MLSYACAHVGHDADAWIFCSLPVDHLSLPCSRAKQIRNCPQPRLADGDGMLAALRLEIQQLRLKLQATALEPPPQPAVPVSPAGICKAADISHPGIRVQWPCGHRLQGSFCAAAVDQHDSLIAETACANIRILGIQAVHVGSAATAPLHALKSTVPPSETSQVHHQTHQYALAVTQT